MKVLAGIFLIAALVHGSAGAQEAASHSVTIVVPQITLIAVDTTQSAARYNFRVLSNNGEIKVVTGQAGSRKTGVHQVYTVDADDFRRAAQAYRVAHMLYPPPAARSAGSDQHLVVTITD